MERWVIRRESVLVEIGGLRGEVSFGSKLSVGKRPVERASQREILALERREHAHQILSNLTELHEVLLASSLGGLASQGMLRTSAEGCRSWPRSRSWRAVLAARPPPMDEKVSDPGKEQGRARNRTSARAAEGESRWSNAEVPSCTASDPIPRP